MEDNIEMNLKKTGWEDKDWIHWAQDRNKWQAIVNMVMNLWVLQNLGNFLINREAEAVSFIRKTLPPRHQWTDMNSDCLSLQARYNNTLLHQN